jgi:hypothetical protein
VRDAEPLREAIAAIRREHARDDEVGAFRRVATRLRDRLAVCALGLPQQPEQLNELARGEQRATAHGLQ